MCGVALFERNATPLIVVLSRADEEGPLKNAKGCRERHDSNEAAGWLLPCHNAKRPPDSPRSFAVSAA